MRIGTEQMHAGLHLWLQLAVFTHMYKLSVSGSNYNHINKLAALHFVCWCVCINKVVVTDAGFAPKKALCDKSRSVKNLLKVFERRIIDSKTSHVFQIPSRFVLRSKCLQKSISLKINLQKMWGKSLLLSQLWVDDMRLKGTINMLEHAEICND